MKLKKVLYIFVCILFVVSFINNVYASDGIVETGKDWIKTGESGSTFKIDPSSIGLNQIAGLLQGIGILLAVGIGIILGIVFIFSSAEGKAEIKKIFMPYLIGVIIVVGALTIWRVSIAILDVV